MPMPPDNVPASELWSKLMEVPLPSKVVDFPRKGPNGEPICQVAIVAMSQEEQMACSAAAERLAREVLKETPKEADAKLGYVDIYNNAAAVEILFRACKDPKDLSRSFFPSPKEMRKKMSIDEIGVLFSHYMTAQAEMSPISADLSVDEMEAWCKRLKEGGSRFPLDLLSSVDVKNLAYSLACRLYDLQMDISSVGLPQEEPITTL